MKIAVIGDGDSDLVFKLLSNLKFERTFAFSINKRAKFNEHARRVGFNVIILNPNYLNWKEELKVAIEDFNPNIILNFGFKQNLDEFDVFDVIEIGGIIVVEYKKKVAFIGNNFEGFIKLF